jgi:hypothetical protein
MGKGLIKSGIIAVLTGGLASITGVRAAAPPGADSKKANEEKKSSKSTDEREAEKTADKILEDTNGDDPLLVNRWYDQVLPALKRKYKKVAFNATYDAWRRRYFENDVLPKMIKLGYNPAEAREAFLKLTERQTPP